MQSSFEAERLELQPSAMHPTAPPPPPPATKAATFSINITDAKSSEAILKILAAEFGWREMVQAQLPKPPPSHAPPSALAAYRAALKPLAPPKGSIIWTVCPEALEQSLLGRRGDQRVSHIPGMHGLCSKVPFTLLARAHGLTDFFPETWIVECGSRPVCAVGSKPGLLVLLCCLAACASATSREVRGSKLV